MDEQDESPKVSFPDDETDLITRLEEERERELTEEEKHLAVAQAKLIGDL